MATDVDTDLNRFMGDIKELISDLEKEEEIEQEIMQEQRDAEQKLAEALEEIQRDPDAPRGTANNQDALSAVLYFREVDFDAPHAEVHQQVEKILDNLTNVGGAGQLQSQLQNVQHAVGKIERALEELQDVYQKTSQDVKQQQQDISDLKEIQQIIGRIQQGAQNYSQWAQGER